MQNLGKTRSIVFATTLCAVLFAVFASNTHAQAPLKIEDAMGVLSLSGRTPISLSPDGTWVAYTVQDDRKHDSTNDKRYMFYIPSGAFTEALGCDIWISNTKTGESKNLTQGKGTSWGPVWSPDGKYLAFYSDRSGTAHVWVWEAASAKMRQLSEGIVKPFFNFQVMRWSPDSRKLLVKVLPEGMTVEQAADLTTGPAEKKEETKKAATGPTVTVFTHIPADEKAAAKSEAPKADADGAANWTNRYRADLALVDVSTGSIEHAAKNVKPLGYWFSPDGKYFAYTSWAGTEPNTQQPYFELAMVNIADKSRKTLVPRVHQDYGISVSWSPDSRSVAYLTSGQKAVGDCYVVSIDGGEPINLTETKHPSFGDDHRAPLWDASGESIYVISGENYGQLGNDTIWKISVRNHSYTVAAKISDRVILELLGPSTGGRIWSPDGGRSIVAGVRNESTKQVGFYKIDTTNGSSTKLFEDNSYFGRDLLFTQDISADGKVIIYAAQDAQHPEDIWAASGDFSGRHRVSNINPVLKSESFGTSKVIEWRSTDGEVLHGALLLPANYQQGKRYPMIVNPYGGSYRSETVNRFGLSGSGVENLQILASRGYAVLLPDAPLHEGSPMVDLMKTIIPGVDRAVELGIADPERLGVMGHSYGGYSTLSLIVQTTRFRAAVDSAGIADLISGYGEMDPVTGGSGSIGWSETGQGRMRGTPWQVRDRYIENSPIFFLDRVQTPLLIVQGELDGTVPRQQAEQVFTGLRRLNKEVVYAIYAGEEHWEGTWGLANAIDYWTRVIDWFDSHLKSTASSTAAAAKASD